MNYRYRYMPAEMLYNFAIGNISHIGVNWQRFVNPADNRNRGPVSVAPVPAFRFLTWPFERYE
jgi:hypothetical protein